MCEHANYAVRKCPFLASLAKEHGQEYASSIAIAPLTPVGSAPLPQGTDAVAALASSFRLFHGPEGAVPLAKGPHARSAARGGAGGCPFHARASASGQTAAASGVALSSAASAVPGPSAAPPQAHAAPAAAQAPFATISLSNFGKGPNFGDFLRKQLKNHSNSNKPSSQRPQRSGAPNSSAGKAPHGPGASSSSNNSASTGRTGPSSNTSSFKPQRPLGDPGSFPGSTAAGGGGAAAGGGGRFPGASGSKPPGAASAAAGSTFSASSSSTSPTLGGSATTGSSSAASSWQAGSSSAGSSPLQQQRLRGSNNSSTGSSSNTARGGGSSKANTSSKSGAPDSKGGRGGTGGSISRGSFAAASGGVGGSGGAPAPSACPLRKWLGPMAGLVFNEYDKIVCPPAIVAARAALAKTSAVQQLRPQALPVKLVAVAAVVAGVNLPCGAVREHFEKFSVGWFIAVHATIPFVAMLRKAVIMPKYAMLVTIAAAVMGQLVGSRVERYRLQYEQQHGPLLPAPEVFFSQLLSAPQPAPAQPAAAVTAATAPGAAGPAAAKTKNKKQDGAAGGSSSSNGRDKHWRERLAADPVEPAVAGRCGSSSGGGALGGLFARLPTVKA